MLNINNVCRNNMGLMLLVVMYNECTNVLKSKIAMLNKANTLKWLIVYHRIMNINLSKNTFNTKIQKKILHIYIEH